MRYISLITLVLFFFACGGDPKPSGQNNASTVNSTPNPTPVNRSVITPSALTVPTYSKAPDPNRKLENPNISIEVEGLGNGKCYLVGLFTDQFYRLDSAMATNGKVVFKSNKPYTPGFAYFMLPDNKTTVSMLVDADQTFSMKTKMTNLAGAMQVEGSLDNQLFYQTLKYESAQKPQYQNISNRMSALTPGTPQHDQLKAEQKKLGDDRMNYLNKVFMDNPTSLFTAFKEGGQNPNLDQLKKPDGTIDTAGYLYNYRRLFWANVNFNDDRLLYTPIISNKLKKFITELTPQNPDSIRASASFLVDQVLDKQEYYKYFANWITLNYEPAKTTLMDSEAVFVHMIQNYFTYDRAFWSDSVEVHGLQLRAYEMSSSLVGQKGLNVTANDPNGTQRSIFDSKSDYVVVYLWNPECEHCAEETPQLVQLYKQEHPRGMDVFGIAVNTEDEKWRKAIKDYGMPWVNVYDPTNRAIYATYFVDNTPEIYILNPDRTIIGKNLKVDQVMTIVNRDKKERGLM